ASRHPRRRGGDGQGARGRVRAEPCAVGRLRRAVPALRHPARHVRRRHDDARPAAPARGGGMSVAALREEVCALHAELPRAGLVAWTSGNLSARVPGEDAMVIKASGVSFDDLTPEAMVVCDLAGTVVHGELSPSSDTLTHAYI